MASSIFIASNLYKHSLSHSSVQSNWYSFEYDKQLHIFKKTVYPEPSYFNIYYSFILPASRDNKI